MHRQGGGHGAGGHGHIGNQPRTDTGQYCQHRPSEKPGAGVQSFFLQGKEEVQVAACREEGPCAMAGGESEALRAGRLRRGFLTGFQEVQEAWVCVGIRRQGTGEQLGIDIGQANGGAAVFLMPMVITPMARMSSGKKVSALRIQDAVLSGK